MQPKTTGRAGPVPGSEEAQDLARLHELLHHYDDARTALLDAYDRRHEGDLGDVALTQREQAFALARMEVRCAVTGLAGAYR